LAAKALEITQGSVSLAAVILLLLSAVGSATFDQAPLVAYALPFVQELSTQLGASGISVDSQPLWWALAIGATVGGAATLIGSSVNLLAAGIVLREGQSFSFGSFIKIAGPISLLLLVIGIIYGKLFLF
jgi:Na+/H+ antiporter NhaD/arsenite permease-like protein